MQVVHCCSKNQLCKFKRKRTVSFCFNYVFLHILKRPVILMTPIGTCMQKRNHQSNTKGCFFKPHHLDMMFDKRNLLLACQRLRNDLIFWIQGQGVCHCSGLKICCFHGKLGRNNAFCLAMEEKPYSQNPPSSIPPIST